MNPVRNRDIGDPYDRECDFADRLLDRVAELEEQHEIMVNREHDQTVLMLRYRSTLEALRANLCAMTQTPIIESWIGIIDAATHPKR